ncbi:MAG: hypothetical protein ACFBSE_13790 [Prochloraceae cyanobacterium]
MSHKVDLKISFSSSDPIALMKAICHSLKPFNQKLPSRVTDGFEKYTDTDTQNWIDELIPKFQYDVMADWGVQRLGEYNEGFITYNPSEEVVSIKISDYDLVNAETVMKMLAPLPWAVANFYPIHNDCGWDDYIAPGFLDGHGGHGWACAFKLEGHAHLVSFRWLDFGPWHLLEDEINNISFVQFHDLNADPAIALEQAKPGHRAMSIYGVGGYIGKTHPFSNDLRGIYVPETCNMRVIIPAGFEVTYTFMSDYCAARHFQAFVGKPFTTLSFVFIDAAEAEPYLHDLWLREIECFGITPQGVEVRLDEGYNPTPNKPEWVRKLEELDGIITN